jgi:hypothetical protein
MSRASYSAFGVRPDPHLHSIRCGQLNAEKSVGRDRDVGVTTKYGDGGAAGLPRDPRVLLMGSHYDSVILPKLAR